MKFLFTLILFPLFHITAENGRVLFYPNWEKYRVEISSKLKLKPNIREYHRGHWKDWIREQTIGRASSSLENFLVNDKMVLKDLLRTNPDFARKYAIFLESLHLHYFSIQGKYALADILIKVRGGGSLLGITPLSWGTLSYKDLEASEYVGEAYQKEEAQGAFDKSLAPMIYSGLIIDVRGHGFRPSLSPKIYSQGGEFIYGAEYIHPKPGLQRGVAGFSKSIDSREVKRRTGDKPMFIVALGVSGEYKTNAVISYQDQKKFFDHKESIKNLLKCKVAFIVN